MPKPKKCSFDRMHIEPGFHVSRSGIVDDRFSLAPRPYVTSAAGQRKSKRRFATYSHVAAEERGPAADLRKAKIREIREAEFAAEITEIEL